MYFSFLAQANPLDPQEVDLKVPIPSLACFSFIPLGKGGAITIIIIIISRDIFRRG
jgi:hypothetical protein